MNEYIKEVAGVIVQTLDYSSHGTINCNFVAGQIKLVINRFARENELPIPYLDDNL